MILVYDRLAKVLYDEERDCEYPAWKCMNDNVIANRVNVMGAIENVYIINASATLNSRIAYSIRSVLETKRIDLLVDLDDATDVIQKTAPNYDSGDIETQIFYERPYMETQALINEMVSLEFTKNEQTGIVTLYETGSNTKDRYVSLAYGNYFVEQLEKDFLSNSEEYEYACLVN